MAIRSLVIAPDARLKIKSTPVEKVDDSVRALIDDLFDTMYHFNGIGLAAVQVGVHSRVLVMDVEQQERGAAHSPLALINPEVAVDGGDMSVYNEGCLSFPDQYSEVERPAEVTVKYLDRDGKPQLLTASGLLATCVQHEIDHLDGIVFVDHISRLKREMILKKMQKAKKMHEDHHHVHGEHCNH